MNRPALGGDVGGHGGQSAARSPGTGVRRDRVDRGLQVLQIMEPAERILSSAQRLDLMIDAQPAQIPNEFQHVPQLLGRDAGLVEAGRRIERSHVA